jgi:serine/threonine-protein kinase
MDVVAGRYRLIERLGAGGMSVVWRGYDEVLGRQVAVKLLAAEFHGDADFRGRVRREARAAARLSHPNITNVYDYGEAADGTPYVVMELVDGQSLAHRLESGPLSVRAAVRMAAQVASALAAAHAQGLVHRDVTPANVMLAATGAKVVDFGISAAVGEWDRAVLGTPAYLAPEQLAGGPAQSATDVYALGLVISVSITGRLPRPPALPGLLVTPPPRPGLPPELAELVSACLATDPAARPGSAVVARRLTELAGDPPTTVQLGVPGRGSILSRRTAARVSAGTRVLPPPPPEPAPPAWVRRRRRWPWAFSSLVVLVLVFLAGTLFAGARRGSSSTDPAAIDPPTSAAPPKPAPSPTPALACTVTYHVSVQIGSRFSTDVQITNSGKTSISGWTLVFDLPGEQHVDAGWAGDFSQSDRTVTVHDVILNRSLGPGKSTTIGFFGSKGSKNAKPATFTLNGVHCLTAR